MLTKRLSFDNEVLTNLRSMEWRNDGKLGIITGGQLERDLYTRLNKALVAMGGKWDRKAGGHVFQFDPRDKVEGLLENGSLTVERDGFFETPPAVIDRMLELLPRNAGWYVLEPSAGLGAIADKVNASVCVEKNEERARYLASKGHEVCHCDFLTDYNPLYLFDAIYMNPPFEELQDIDHVLKAYSLLEVGGSLVSVMSESPFFRQDKKAVQFREWLSEKNGYSEKLPEGSFKKSGTGVNARLVLIRKETL